MIDFVAEQGIKAFNDDVANPKGIKDITKADILTVLKTIKECNAGTFTFLTPVLPTTLPVD